MNKKKIILIVITIICIICTGCSNQKEEELPKKSPELEDYPQIKEDVTNVIIELKESNQFDDLEFDEFKMNESYDDPKITYDVLYKTNSSTLWLHYNEKKEFNGISLNKGYLNNEYFSELTFYNQMLAITYLKRYDINESDFPDRYFDNTYEDYVNFMAGISDKTIIYTNGNKNLILTYYPKFYDFGIWG